jgi:magnesium transporter
VILALVNFGKMMLIDNVTVPVAIVVSVTVLMTVIIAKLIGAVLPMIAKKIGLDPAVMASPLITTLCDAISLLLYFKVAEIIIGI